MVFITPTGERLAQDRRRSKRWSTRSTCAIRGPSGEPTAVTLHNISQGGFGAECSEPYADGDQLTFRLGRIGFAPAQVMWRIGSAVGCKFLREVTAAEVALTLKTAPPARGDEPGTPF